MCPSAIYENPEEATTADTKHDSTGLGLTIAQELAHLHRGEIMLQSEPGKGSCFTLCLPLLDAE